MSSFSMIAGSEPLTILGGGPAGLATAFYSRQVGITFTLFERSRRLGGLCRTLSLGPHRYDTGAHRFHDRDHDITSDLVGLLGDDLVPVVRPSKVLIRGKFIDFPPTPINVILGSGVFEVPRIGFDILRNRSVRRPVVSFEDFAVRSFGKTLARRFLLNYSQKVWGLPPDKLSPAVATRRLKGMSLRTLILELVDPTRKTAHLDGSFYYPRGGYGLITDRLAAALPQAALRTECNVTAIEVRDSTITHVHFERGESHRVKGLVVGTLPLSLMPHLIRGIEVPQDVRRAADSLLFRDIRLVFLRLSRPRVTENASIYVPDPEYRISRIYEPKNRSEQMAPPNETGLVAEVPCFRSDEIAALPAPQLKDQVIAELEQLGLVERSEVLDWSCHYLNHAYPVYSLDFESKVKRILAFLDQIGNLEVVGRNGLFHYSHLHDQMRFAKDLTQALASSQEAVLPAGTS